MLAVETEDRRNAFSLDVQQQYIDDAQCCASRD